MNQLISVFTLKHYFAKKSEEMTFLHIKNNEEMTFKH